MLTEEDSIISSVITFASALVVSFSVMCPGELIIPRETKAILFPVSQDANLFWLVILLWGLFAAAPSIKARSNTPSPHSGSCVSACASQISSWPIFQKYPLKCCLTAVTIKGNTHDLANVRPPAEMFGSGGFTGWMGLPDTELGDHFAHKAADWTVNAHTFFACSWCSAKLRFVENNIVHCRGIFFRAKQWFTAYLFSFLALPIFHNSYFNAYYQILTSSTAVHIQT